MTSETPKAKPGPAALDAGACDLDRDIGILLSQIDWLSECTGEDLDTEDAALVHQIRVDHEARAMLHAAPQPPASAVVDSEQRSVSSNDACVSPVIDDAASASAGR